MKVKATQLGYYGLARRYPGDVFNISDEKDAAGNVKAFSKRWMESVDNNTPERANKPKLKPIEPRPIIEPKKESTPSQEGDAELAGQPLATGDSEVI